MIFIYLVAILLLYIWLMVLIVNYSLKYTCRKEMKGTDYGRFSSDRFFEIVPENMRQKGNLLYIKGKYKGAKPSFNNLVHIYSMDKDVAGLIRKVKEENGYSEIKIFVPEKIDIRNVDSISTVRKTYKDVNKQLPGEYNYPIHLKKSLYDILVSIMILAMGLMYLVFARMAWDQLAGKIFLVMGVLFTPFAIAIFIETATSSITLKDNEKVYISRNFKKLVYDVSDIRIYTTKDSKSRLILHIQDSRTKKQILAFSEKTRGFYELYAALKINIERSIYKRRYIPLFVSEFYIHKSQYGGTVYRSNEDGYKTLLAFANMEDAMKYVAYRDTCNLKSFDEIISITLDFEMVDAVDICFGEDEWITVDKTRYEKMCKYKDEI